MGLIVAARRTSRNKTCFDITWDCETVHGGCGELAGVPGFKRAADQRGRRRCTRLTEERCRYVD